MIEAALGQGRGGALLEGEPGSGRPLSGSRERRRLAIRARASCRHGRARPNGGCRSRPWTTCCPMRSTRSCLMSPHRGDAHSRSRCSAPKIPTPPRTPRGVDGRARGRPAARTRSARRGGDRRPAVVGPDPPGPHIRAPPAGTRRGRGARDAKDRARADAGAPATDARRARDRPADAAAARDLGDRGDHPATAGSEAPDRIGEGCSS